MKKQLIVTFSILAGLLVLIVCCVSFSKDRKQENINCVLPTSGEDREDVQEPENQTVQDFLEEITTEETEEYSAGHNRYLYFEVSGVNPEEKRLVVSFDGRYPGEIEKFCNDVCDLAENFSDIPSNEIYFYVSGEKQCFLFETYFRNKNRTQLYNDLYEFVEKVSLEKSNERSYEQEKNSQRNTGSDEADIDEEWVKSLLSYNADCGYVLQDGSGYRMVGTDRACGSTYYTLIHVSADERNCELINSDPYLGSGGNANWITFLKDEKIGFSCLAYSGGSLGQLYRTEDGGRSFSSVTYPSGMVKLSDGTYYNPFVMPVKIWEEDDILYLDVGQGPDGDYYNDEGFCHGLYSSTDKGITWKYEKEFAVTRGEDEEW